MPSPFPGMDPYLETPDLWPDVHHELISQIRQALNPLLRPRYVTRVAVRKYVSDEDDPGREVLAPPLRPGGEKPSLIDEEIKEARLEIRHRGPSGAVVTVIELVNPATKIIGSRGRKSFMDKRSEVLNSDLHWVEIDLLRSGVPSIPEVDFPSSDYRIFVSRQKNRPRMDVWPFNVRDPLPIIGIPLGADEADVPLDLGVVLHTGYDKAEYDASIDYRKPPEPPLNPADAKWANALLRQQGLR